MVLHTVLRKLPAHREEHYDAVVVCCSLIGDFVLWASTLDSYREKYKGKNTLLIVYNMVEEIAALSNAFTDVVAINPKKILNNPSYHYRLMSHLRRITADELISPSYRHQLSGDLVCAMIGSPQKICYKSYRITTIKSGFGDFLWKYSKKWVDKYFDNFFTDFIELPDDKQSEIETIEYFTQRVINGAYQYRLSDISYITSGYECPISVPYMLLSTSSSRTIKDWPIERFTEILKRIPSEFAIVLSGHGDHDMKDAEEVIRNDNGCHTIFNFVNKTTIIEMMGLISHASFVIGNDSAAVHIAAASRVPSICITHGACFGQFVPYPESIPEREFHPRCVYKKMDCYGCNYNCIKDFKEPLYCLRQVTVEMVVRELENLLRTT